MSSCEHKGELHWHVTRCKHGQWPILFCRKCNGLKNKKKEKERNIND